jgi:hypothetical protein
LLRWTAKISSLNFFTLLNFPLNSVTKNMIKPHFKAPSENKRFQ